MFVQRLTGQPTQEEPLQVLGHALVPAYTLFVEHHINLGSDTPNMRQKLEKVSRQAIYKHSLHVTTLERTIIETHRIGRLVGLDSLLKAFGILVQERCVVCDDLPEADQREQSDSTCGRMLNISRLMTRKTTDATATVYRTSQ